MVHNGTWMGNLITSAHAHTNAIINENDSRSRIKHTAIKKGKKL